jgi:hypothetical protein
MNQLKLIKRKDIDEQKWNRLVAAAFNGLPYAFSWYLDDVAENWDALVLRDYEAGMPLVWLRKMGLKCLYQPYYCQQLGVFSSAVLSVDLQAEFLGETSAYAYVNINLNPAAQVLEMQLSLKRKRNLLLNLDQEYASIRKKYSDNHRRNIGKAEKGGQQFAEQIGLKDFQQFYLQNINPAKENFKPQHEKIFKKLTQTLVTNGYGQIFAAKDKEGNLTAALMLLKHKNRLINVINTSSAEGKQTGASHFLFDRLIHKFSGRANIFDFEGSSIASIARFYEGFGPTEEVFYNYQNTILKRASQLFR